MIRATKILTCVWALSGCASFNLYDVIEQRGVVVGEATHITVKHRGVWVTYPKPQERSPFMGIPGRECYQSDHNEWAECMGVGYR